MAALNLGDGSSRRNSPQIRRRRERLWSEDPNCCWCREPMVLAAYTAGGRPEPLMATLEHPRSRKHADGRSGHTETHLSHAACNHVYSRIENALAVGQELRPVEAFWLVMVAGRREQQDPIIRDIVEQLMAATGIG